MENSIAIIFSSHKTTSEAGTLLAALVCNDNEIIGLPVRCCKVVLVGRTV